MNTITIESNDVTAAILAGGLGTRLRGVVSDRPKVMAPVSGRPFLTYLLDQLAAASVRRAVLCTGHLAEQIESFCGSACHGVELTYSREQAPLGTGGAMRLALPALEAQTVIVLNGDSYCGVDMRALLGFHRRSGAAVTLALAAVPDTSRFGRVDADDDGTITAFSEKGGRSGAGWINAGVYVIDRPVLEQIPDRRAVSFEREVLEARVGGALMGFRSAGRFLDIGTPQSYAAAERFFARELAA